MEAERENPEVGGHGNSDGEREALAWRIIVTGTLRPEILPTTVATICRRSIYTFSFSFFSFFAFLTRSRYSVITLATVN